VSLSFSVDLGICCTTDDAALPSSSSRRRPLILTPRPSRRAFVAPVFRKYSSIVTLFVRTRWSTWQFQSLPTRRLILQQVPVPYKAGPLPPPLHKEVLFYTPSTAISILVFLHRNFKVFFLARSPMDPCVASSNSALGKYLQR
jgi:hypothetical protein